MVEKTTPVAVSKDEDGEYSAIGQTPISIYWKYLRYGANYFTIAALVVLLFAAQANFTYTEVFLVEWAKNGFEEQQRPFYFAWYGGLALTTIALSLGRTLLFIHVLLSLWEICLTACCARLYTRRFTSSTPTRKDVSSTDLPATLAAVTNGFLSSFSTVFNA